MAFVHTTGFSPESLYPGLAVVWGRAYKQHESYYKKFFNIKDSDKSFEKEQQITDLPIAAVKEQGQEAFFSRLYQGFQKEYSHLTYSLGAVITREMYEDDLYGTMTMLPEMLARSMKHTEEIVHTNVLNNGFTTQLTADGLTLFNDAHILVNGSTQRNQLATSADLTETSLEDVVIQIERFVDDQGKRMNAQPVKLVVPTEYRFIASKILDTEYKTGSADNDKNIISTKYNLDLIVTPFLTDTDAWFVTTDVPNGLTGYVRREAEIDRDNVFRTQNLEILTTKRFSAGVTDFRGVFGSAGA